MFLIKKYTYLLFLSLGGNENAQSHIKVFFAILHLSENYILSTVERIHFTLLSPLQKFSTLGSKRDLHM
jgi:hypothetical protein